MKMNHLLTFTWNVLCIGVFYLSYALGIATYNTTIQRICLRLARTNILYVKIFQWCAFSSNSKNNQIINPELYDFFSSFKDKALYGEADIDYDALDQHIQNVKNGNGTLTLLRKPINSGSIALVFHGVYNEKEVAIKVLRKDIHLKMAEFMHQMNYFLWFMQLVGLLTVEDGEIVLRNFESFVHQIDLMQEARNMELFAFKYTKNKKIVIPRVYTEFTERNPRVLMMEYLHGKTIRDLEPHEYMEYSFIFGKLTLSYIFKDVFHGDMHSGNLVFMHDPVTHQRRLGLIDYGLVGVLDVDLQNALYDISVVLFHKKTMREFLIVVIQYTLRSPENEVIVRQKKEKQKEKEKEKEKESETEEHVLILEVMEHLIHEVKMDVTRPSKKLNGYDILVCNKCLQLFDYKISSKLYSLLFNFVAIMDTMEELGKYRQDEDDDSWSVAIKDSPYFQTT